MKVYQFAIPKARLAAMPRSDRTLFLLLGHAFNEVNVLMKLVILGMNGISDKRILRRAETGQVLIFTRLLIGKLHESWELIRTRVLSNPHVAAAYLAALKPPSSDALQSLKTRFGQSNLIGIIRNSYAFHMPSDDDIETNFDRLNEGPDYGFYLTQRDVNSFYDLSESVVSCGVLRQVALNGDNAEAVDALFRLVHGTAGELTTLFGGLLLAIVEKNFPGVIPSEVADVDGLPKLLEHPFPFYLDDEIPS